MKIRIKQLHPDAVKPTYAKPGDACFDLRAIKETRIESMDVGAVQTGIAIEVPEGHALLLHSRSGHGKLKISLANSTGIIDSGYRGELILLVQNLNEETDFVVKAGDRIAQGMIVPIVTADLEWADELSSTERGEGGLGHSGVK